jgi:HTH-type transcriptional regulator/antitoxin HigA
MATVAMAQGRDLYLELIQRFPLRRIHTDAELREAIAIIDELIARPSLAPMEREYLDVLSDQVERYEAQEHPMRPATNAETLRYLMDARGLTQARLAKALHIQPSLVSEVLSGKKGLSKANITALARYFSVSPAVFFPE